MVDPELIHDEERRPKSLVYATTLLYDPGEMPLAGGGILSKVRPISLLPALHPRRKVYPGA